MTTIARHPDEDRVRLRLWLRGDQHAVTFVEQFFFICHLWDDLIDKDKERTEQDINLAFQLALLDIHENPFYQKNLMSLHPVIRAAVNDWYTANTLEKTGDSHELDIAYTLRCSILSVISHCAYLIGGTEWVNKVGPEIRRYGQEHSLAQYKEDQKCLT